MDDKQISKYSISVAYMIMIADGFRQNIHIRQICVYPHCKIPDDNLHEISGLICQFTASPFKVKLWATILFQKYIFFFQ